MTHLGSRYHAIPLAGSPAMGAILGGPLAALCVLGEAAGAPRAIPALGALAVEHRWHRSGVWRRHTGSTSTHTCLNSGSRNVGFGWRSSRTLQTSSNIGWRRYLQNAPAQ